MRKKMLAEALKRKTPERSRTLEKVAVALAFALFVSVWLNAVLFGLTLRLQAERADLESQHKGDEHGE